MSWCCARDMLEDRVYPQLSAFPKPSLLFYPDDFKLLPSSSVLDHYKLVPSPFVFDDFKLHNMLASEQPGCVEGHLGEKELTCCLWSLSQNGMGGRTCLRSPGSRGKGSSYTVATLRHGSMCTWSHRPDPSSSQRPSEAHASGSQEHLSSGFLAGGRPSCRAGDILQCHDMR